jgi:hypothetical protein
MEMKKYYISVDVEFKEPGIPSPIKRVFYILYRRFFVFKKILAVFSKSNAELFESFKTTRHEFSDDNSAKLWFKLRYGG